MTTETNLGHPMEGRRWVRAIPLSLTALRGALAPAMVLLALYDPAPVAFGACLVAAFLSDVFDGIVARHLKIAAATLRRLDSIADTLFYLGAIAAVGVLYPHAILGRLPSISVLIVLELGRYGFDLTKFGREASYHMWSSKLWGVALFAGFYSLLVLGSDGLPVTLAIYIGIVADLEGVAISLVLKEWRVDVPTVFHALAYNRRA